MNTQQDFLLRVINYNLKNKWVVDETFAAPNQKLIFKLHLPWRAGYS